MIKERIEKDGIIKGYYASSHILASEYVTDKKLLTITFGTGARYNYLDVPLTDFVAFEAADSQGKILNSIIKPKYKVEKMANADLEVLKEEIATAKKLELDNYKNNLKLLLDTVMAEELNNFNNLKDTYHMMGSYVSKMSDFNNSKKE